MRSTYFVLFYTSTIQNAHLVNQDFTQGFDHQGNAGGYQSYLNHRPLDGRPKGRNEVCTKPISAEYKSNVVNTNL